MEVSASRHRIRVVRDWNPLESLQRGVIDHDTFEVSIIHRGATVDVDLVVPVGDRRRVPEARPQYLMVLSRDGTPPPSSEVEFMDSLEALLTVFTSKDDESRLSALMTHDC